MSSEPTYRNGLGINVELLWKHKKSPNLGIQIGNMVFWQYWVSNSHIFINLDFPLANGKFSCFS